MRHFTHIKTFIEKHGFTLFSVFVYLVFSVYYMGPSVTSCDTTTYGFGDNTAGPIWRGTLADQDMYGSFTDVTNYPYGDELRSPVNDLFLLQMPLIKSFQAIAGPICGYNLLNLTSFVISSLVMFGFILFLTRSRWIALFAGFAAAFSPYYQMKIGGHPTYGLQAVFIGLIWLFFRLLTYRRKRDAVFLGLAWVFALYIDPYFSLLSSIVLFALFAAWAIVNRGLFTRRGLRQDERFKDKRKEFKLLALATAIIFVVSIPFLSMYAFSSAQIGDDVAAARGNVIAEAKACSNWPHEYLVPFVLHPVFKSLLGGERYQSTVDSLKQDFSCGIGEDTVGISITLAVFSGVGLIILTWEWINRRRTNLSKIMPVNPKIVIISLLLVGVIAAIMALPPVRFNGVIPTPSYELLSITSTWRTLTRFYMLVNIAVVALASILLAYFWRKFAKKKRLLVTIFVAGFGFVFLEYQAFPPFVGNSMSTFNYVEDTPAVYAWLKEQKEIKVIAEYPLEQYGKESDAMSYYLTMQPIHDKKIYNSALSNGQQEQYRDGLKNLADPQTLRVLRAQGVDAVVVHGVPEQEVQELVDASIIFSAPPARFSISNHSPVVKVDNTVVLSLENIIPATHYLDLGKGFVRNAIIIKSVVDWRYEAINGAELLVQEIENQKVAPNNNTVDVCFAAQMSVPEESTRLFAVLDGADSVDLGPISGDLSLYKISAKQKVKLTTENGHNIRVTSLGCQNG